MFQLFVELEELYLDDHEYQWKERARWIKFEEDVEEDVDRWGKPHVASLSFHSLLELRKCIEEGESLNKLEQALGVHEMQQGHDGMQGVEGRDCHIKWFSLGWWPVSSLLERVQAIVSMASAQIGLFVRGEELSKVISSSPFL